MTNLKTKIHILLVDDEESLTWAIKECSTNNNWIIHQANNVHKAIEILDEEHISLIVSDYKMAHLTGIDLLKNVRSRNQDIKFILMTAYPSTDVTIEAIQLGIDDIIIKPFDIDQVIHRIDQKLTQNRIKIDTNAEYFKYQLPEQKTVSNRFEVKDIQYFCNDNVNTGDFILHIDMGDHIFISIGDISGNGQDVVEQKTILREWLRVLAYEYSSPSQIAKKIKNMIRSFVRNPFEFSLFCAFYFPADKNMKYINLGHENPLLISKERKTVYQLSHLGLMSIQANDEILNQEIKVCAEDEIFLFTDGVNQYDLFKQLTQATNLDFSQFEKIYTSIKEKKTFDRFTEDASFGIYKFCDYDLSQLPNSISIKNEINDLSIAIDNTEKWANKFGLSKKWKSELIAAVVEGVSNAIMYAYESEGKIEIHYQVEQNSFLIEIKDAGKGFDYRQYQKKSEKVYQDILRANQRGILIMKAMSDHCDVESKERNGTIVRIRKNISHG